jgi:hypothetical protein
VPFRSEGEQVREQIRRVHEVARELLEEQSELERQVKVQEAAARGRSLLGLLVAVVAVVATTFIGFETGALEAEKREARSMEEVERDEAARLDVDSARLEKCSRERDRVTPEDTMCRRDVAALEYRLRVFTLPAPLDYAPRPGLR